MKNLFKGTSKKALRIGLIVAVGVLVAGAAAAYAVNGVNQKREAAEVRVEKSVAGKVSEHNIPADVNSAATGYDHEHNDHHDYGRD